MKTIAFDIETRDIRPDDEKSLAALGLAVTYDGKRFQTWFTKAELCDYLRAEVAKGATLVGHNAIDFDLVVLGCADLAHATVDTMLPVVAQTAVRGKGYASLDTLARYTLGQRKIDVKGDGGACGLADRGRNGDRAALMLCIDYCKQDTKLAHDLYMFGKKHGYLLTEGNLKINVAF